MAATFGGATSVAAPAAFDAAASQSTGAATSGIGLKNDDGDHYTGMTDTYIGGATAVHTFETTPS
jgi:hypothetical protein